MPRKASVSLGLGLALFAAVAALAGGAPAARAEVRKGDRVTDFVQVVDGAGRRVSLKRFRDKVVVLTFGASWCEPCKRELPALEKLARRYEQRKARVVFFAVNIDSEPAKGVKFMKQAGLRAVRALYDSRRSTVESYDPPRMPSTYIIRGGVVRHVHAGFSAGDERALAAAIDGQLGAIRD
jgi:thiol-disulfide isomerase/thioredoxin